VLYLDGAKVASRTDVITAQGYTGYWRIGGDNLNGWPNQPSSFYLNGNIDDVAIYGKALTATEVRSHYTNSGRTVAGSTPPADDYGKAVFSSDPDFYWRLAETSGTTANDTGTNQLPGSYNGGFTLRGPSAVGVTGDKSVTLKGVDGAVASNSTFTNPSVYAEELWFNTTPNRGGS
jgi:trimeric autotransporter adhesin